VLGVELAVAVVPPSFFIPSMIIFASLRAATKSFCAAWISLRPVFSASSMLATATEQQGSLIGGSRLAVGNGLV
jgi:hypothetical protein